MLANQNNPYGNYIRKLRKELKDCHWKYRDVLKNIPAILCLFVKSIRQPELSSISGPKRMEILSAIGYVLSPEDFFPEKDSPQSVGYLDDAYVCFHVLTRMISESEAKQEIEKDWEHLQGKKDWIPSKEITQLAEENRTKLENYLMEEEMEKMRQFCGYKD